MEDGRPRILCVDDEQMVLDGLSRTLRQHFAVSTALGGEAGLAQIAAGVPFEVVVSDMRMPGMNGAAFLRAVRAQSPDTVRMLLTGYAELDAAIAVVNEGHIFRFLTKPCAPEELIRSLRAGVEQYRLVTAERVLLEQTLRGCVKTLTEILALASPTAFGRASRVKQHVSALAALRPDAGDPWQLEVAAMLSQIGCVTLPAQTAEKLYLGQELTRPERDMVDHLPATASQLLANIPRLEAVRAILTYQDKRFDGTGPPPDGQRGERIPIGARLLKVVLDYDALESRGITGREALDTLRGRTGWYDPGMLQAFAEMLGHANQAGKVVEARLRDLRIGMIFAEDLTSRTGMLLIARGQEVTPSLLNRIRNFSESVGPREPVRMLASREASLEEMSASSGAEAV
jgi:response regulator RpfG family c-di-GMP phosphodiesterase